MLFRRAAQIVTIVLVLAAVGLAVWFWKTQNRLYSSATAIRTNELYLKAHSPAEKLPEFPTNFFTSIDVERTTNRIVVAVAENLAMRTPESDYEPLTIHQADTNYAIRVGEGEVRLAYVGVAQAQPVTNFDYGIQVEADYFTPDGKPVRDDAVKMMPGYMKTLSFEGSFPSSQFVFIYSNIATFKTLKFQAFDARTQAQIASGYSSSTFTNGFYYGSDLQVWHQTPIELVATIATGPVVTNTMEVKEGAELEFPEGRLRLLLVSTNDLGGWSSRHDGRTNTMTFNLGRTFSHWANKKTTSFLFHAWPGGFAMPIDFEFVGVDGKTIRGLGAGSSGRFMNTRAEAELDEIQEIRVKYYSQKHRLIFRIPELPGLPEENRGVKNLFDVKIPYAYYRYEYDFQSGLGQMVQMQSYSVPLTFPNGYFPTMRSNTTARELFLEMEKMLSNKDQQLVADPVKNEIRTRKHPVQAFIEMVKKKLGM
ncbi:MAG TPA: hypothetical protein VF773_23220 [Verrucomicrobiae bacterium]